MDRIKLGVATWICNEEEELTEKCLSIIKKTGIGFIEISKFNYFNEEYIQQIVRTLQNGPKVNSFHYPNEIGSLSSPIDEDREKSIREIMQAIDVSARLGVKIIVFHHPLGERDVIWNKEWMESVQKIFSYGQKKSIKVAIENMCPRVYSGNCSDLFKFVKQFNSSWVGICLDTNHIHPGEDLCELVDLLGGKLINIHASDYDGIDERHWYPGEGIINWKSFIKALKRTKYNGVFTYEVDRLKTGMNLEEAVRRVKSNFNMLNQE